MSDRTAARAKAARNDTVCDLLMVSSFGFWALLLGLAPVLAIRMLSGH